MNFSRSTLLCVIVLVLSLQSCKPKFDTLEARSNTVFFLRDSTELHGELLALFDDSLAVLRSDLAQVAPARTITSLHYRQLDAVIFRNDAPALLNGVGGLLGGVIIGGVAGYLLGYLSDGSSGHGGGWGPVIGIVLGVPVGGVTGLVLGVVSGLNETVVIEDREDYLEMSRFARFKDAIELRTFRGY